MQTDSTSSVDQAIDPKLVARIQKMLALSRDGGATEGEAQNAADMAARLMRDNNLSMATIEAAGGEAQEGSKRTKQASQGRAQYEFQQQLMVACAEVNFCVVLLRQTSKYDKWGDYKGARISGFSIIGREANVIATQQLFDYLMSTTERLAFEFVGSDNRMRLSRRAVSFKEGCAGRLGQRLRTRHEEALAEQAREARECNAASQHPAAGGGTALVVVMEDFAQGEEDRNTDFRLGRPEGTTAHKRLMSTKKAELDSAVTHALGAHKGVTDRELLSALAQSAAEAQIANLGLDKDDEEVARILSQAVRWNVDAHVAEAEGAAKWASMTDKQRQAAEEKAQRESDRYWQRYQRQQDAKWERRDHGAYSAGSAAGDRVGLDKQVQHGTSQKGIK